MASSGAASKRKPASAAGANKSGASLLAKLHKREKAALEKLGRDKVIALYRQMHLIRAFEQRSEQMYQQRKIGGFLHVYMGQEALAVGMLAAVRADDYAATSYRDHGIALARGVPASALMAELFGKVTGVGRGKGGSMHFFSKEKNLLGGHGIVGGQIPVGLGAAFRARYLGTDQVSLIFLGDGAANQGTFHESANMASLWSLPAFFIVENNRYGMGTSFERATSVSDLTLKAQGYNMEGVQVDGMRMLECYAVMDDAVRQRRKTPRPILIEAKTYRYRGHSISDPGNYRTKQEIEAYRKIDPIVQIKSLLSELKWLDEPAGKDLERDVRQEVVDAVNFAEESPEPEPAERERHVYAP